MKNTSRSHCYTKAKKSATVDRTVPIDAFYVNAIRAVAWLLSKAIRCTSIRPRQCTTIVVKCTVGASQQKEMRKKKNNILDILDIDSPNIGRVGYAKQSNERHALSERSNIEQNKERSHQDDMPKTQ